MRGKLKDFAGVLVVISCLIGALGAMGEIAGFILTASARRTR
jgi:hypothetical protein